MRGSQCLCNSRSALYRVFVSPSGRPESLGQQLCRHTHAATTLVTSQSSPSSSLVDPSWLKAGSQLRYYANGPKPSRSGRQAGENAASSVEDRGYDKRFTTQRDVDRSGRDRLPWDHEITDPQIMVIDGGASEGPLATRFVLSKLEPGESLRMIQPYIPAGTKISSQNTSTADSTDTKASSSQPSTTPGTTTTVAQYAVCKIVNKREEYERQRQLKERKKAAAAGKPKTKELELTWAIGGQDLATKLRQLGGFLSKGMKVELTFGKKKGGRLVGAEEAAEVLKKVREEVVALGGREGKPASGQVGGTMRMFYEGVKAK